MKALKFAGPNPAPMTSKEVLALADIVKQLPPNPVIVQIGAYIGVSTMAMLESRPDCFIFSIDIKPCLQERVNISEAGLDVSRVVRVLGGASQIDWPFSIDMLFVDGNHYYEAVKADCDAWLDKVNGLIIFHDYIPVGAPARNQVFEVVSELFRLETPIMKAERLIGFERYHNPLLPNPLSQSDFDGISHLIEGK